MAETRLTCPECEATFKTANPVAPGKKVRCPKCKEPFVVPEDEAADDDAEPRKKSKGDASDDDRPAKKKKKEPQKSNVMLILGLAGCGGLLLVGCIASAAGGYWILLQVGPGRRQQERRPQGQGGEHGRRQGQGGRRRIQAQEGLR